MCAGTIQPPARGCFNLPLNSSFAVGLEESITGSRESDHMVPLGTHPAGQAGIVGTGLVHFGVCVGGGGLAHRSHSCQSQQREAPRMQGWGGAPRGTSSRLPRPGPASQPFTQTTAHSAPQKLRTLRWAGPGALTVSASTKSVGHSEQEVSIWEELTNLEPMPRRLSPR